MGQTSSQCRPSVFSCKGFYPLKRRHPLITPLVHTRFAYQVRMPDPRPFIQGASTLAAIAARTRNADHLRVRKAVTPPYLPCGLTPTVPVADFPVALVRGRSPCDARHAPSQCLHRAEFLIGPVVPPYAEPVRPAHVAAARASRAACRATLRSRITRLSTHRRAPHVYCVRRNAMNLSPHSGQALMSPRDRFIDQFPC